MKIPNLGLRKYNGIFNYFYNHFYNSYAFVKLMKHCVVVNKYNSDFDINIQRGTMWGNPFKEGTREENIKKFKPYFLNKIKTGQISKSHLEVLRGMRLGCTCSPKPCHGDIIAEVVNKLFNDKIYL